MNNAHELWPYSERNSLHTEEYVEQLLAPPERPLSQQEQAAVFAFGRDIFVGHYGELHTGTDKSLLDINRDTYAQSIHTFYPDYFMRDEGAADAELLGIPLGSSRALVLERLNDIYAVKSSPVEKELTTIAKRSEDWQRQQVVDHIVTGAVDDANFALPEGYTICYDPEALLSRLEDLQDFRHFYRLVRAELKQLEDSDLKAAKLDVLDMHMAKVNAMTALAYPHAVEFAMQLDMMPFNGIRNVLLDRLKLAVPVLSFAYNQDASDRWQHLQDINERFSSRLDYVRNGVGFAANGELSPIDVDLLAYADELEQPVKPEPILSPEIIAYMAETRWDAGQAKTFTEAVLGKLELLSSDQVTYDEVKDRKGYASDGKWQVVVSPKHNVLTVGSIKRVVFVPADFDRPLATQGEKNALANITHEVAHVVQAENDAELRENLPLAEIKGRRSTTVKEMGGIMVETEFQAFAGYIRYTRPHYLRSLRSKLAGGNLLAATRAYLQSSFALEGPPKSEKAMRSKVKSVIGYANRHWRSGGHNSQALDYIEQAVIADSISRAAPEAKTAIALSGSSFNLVDQVTLHKYGLYNLPEQSKINLPQTVLEVFLDQFLPKELTQS